jgi:methylthioribose-1-phosphate isomerase
VAEKKKRETAEEEKEMVLQAIRYQRGHLEILDQLQLPHRTVYEEVKTRRDAWDAIRKMRVRGAPAIAIVAVLAVAVEVDALLQAAAPPPPLPSPTAHLQASPSSAEPPPPSASTVHDFICESLDYLLSSRPTAVNLADAVAKLKALLHDVRSRATRAEAPLSGADVANAYIAAAERMLDDDVRDNEAIGRHGAEWIRKHVAAASATGTSQEAAGVRVVTHCNTGYGIRVRCGSVSFPVYRYHSALLTGIQSD